MSSSELPDKLMPHGRICPICGMPDFGGSTVCESCGWEFEPEATIEAAEATATVVQSREVGDWLVAGMLFVPSVAVMVLLFYVARLHAFRLPGLKFLVVMAVTSILVASLGMLDAQKLGAGTKGSALKHQPAMWYLLLLIFWPVMLPIYLKTRVAVGRPNFMVFGGIIAGVFVLSSLAIGMVVLNPAMQPAIVLKPGTRLTLKTGKQQGSTGGAGSANLKPKPPDDYRRGGR